MKRSLPSIESLCHYAAQLSSSASYSSKRKQTFGVHVPTYHIVELYSYHMWLLQFCSCRTHLRSIVAFNSILIEPVFLTQHGNLVNVPTVLLKDFWQQALSRFQKRLRCRLSATPIRHCFPCWYIADVDPLTNKDVHHNTSSRISSPCAWVSIVEIFINLKLETQFWHTSINFDSKLHYTTENLYQLHAGRQSGC